MLFHPILKLLEITTMSLNFNAYKEGFTCDSCGVGYDNYAIAEYGVQYEYQADLILCDCCGTDFNNGIDQNSLIFNKLGDADDVETM